ncbi:unnamed protein product, partial [Trifolium pratense]
MLSERDLNSLHTLLISSTPTTTYEPKPSKFSYIQVLDLPANEVIDKIDATFALAYERSPSYNFIYPSPSNVVYSKSIDHLVLKKNGNSNTEDKFKARMIISILEAVRKFLSEGKTVTKRELFYHLSNEFDKQAILDNRLHDIAIMLNCSIRSLNIVSGTRGSIIGNVIFKTKGESFNCNMSPKDIRDGNIISCRAKFIMLVEKYTVLSRLAEDEFHKKYECIIITGRGQPDVLTRQFLRKLSVEYKLPVLALMDCNPSGIQILSGYQYGFINSAYDVI